MGREYSPEELKERRKDYVSAGAIEAGKKREAVKREEEQQAEQGKKRREARKREGSNAPRELVVSADTGDLIPEEEAITQDIDKELVRIGEEQAITQDIDAELARIRDKIHGIGTEDTQISKTLIMPKKPEQKP